MDSKILVAPFLTTKELHEFVGHSTGCIFFNHVIVQQLGDELKAVDWIATPQQIDSNDDIAVLPCANQLDTSKNLPSANYVLNMIKGLGSTERLPGRVFRGVQLGAHSNLSGLGKKFAQMKSSTMAIGLGAQSSVEGHIPDVPDGMLDWLRTIIDLKGGAGPNITLRGKFTLSVLNRYRLADHPIVMGCPTLYMNPDPALDQKIVANLREPRRIAVAFGQRLEASLANLVTARMAPMSPRARWR